MESLIQAVQSHRQTFEERLFEWLRIPSISTDPQYKEDVRRAATWLVHRLETAGLSAEMIETSGHPLVYAESQPVAGAPTVLVYGHYDVQPPDPLDEWTSPPFEPEIRNGDIYARGATDDKGQFLTHVFAVESWLKLKPLPVQVKFLVEGEEECGSAGLSQFLATEAAKKKLECDVVAISDSSQYARNQPAITYGLRGIAYFELRLTGPKQDLHSGGFGGSVFNPANALTQILAQLIDARGRIQVPGFYDDVVELTPDERRQFAELKFSDQAFKNDIGVSATFGEEGYSTLERRWARPSFDINGLWSGYQGQGAKTVLPAKAGAKFSFRLVPNQDHQKIHQALEKQLRQLCPPGIQMELTKYHSADGVLVSLDSPFMSAASAAIAQGFERRPVFIRAGGSIPIVLEFKNRLGVDTLLLGWGLDSDNLHSPNEKFSREDFHRGIRTSCHLLNEIGKISHAAATA